MKRLKVILTLFIGMVLLNACKKEYSFEKNSQKPTGNWEFKDSTHQYTGDMDTAYISGTGASKELHLTGVSIDGNQSFNLILYADTFQTGSYKASLSQISFDYSASGKTIYQASQLNGEFIVNITSINATQVTGNFSGIAKDSANNFKNLFDGNFKANFATLSVGPASSGVLGDSSGNCKPVILSGEYKQGITVTSANTVQVQVTVASAGTYNITTDPVNGITFSKSGTFTSTGVQNITLVASGTPAFPGEQEFALHYGNSQCAFKITFLPGAAPSNDYYPLNVPNDWYYGKTMSGMAMDSFMYKILPDTKTIGANTYSVLGEYDVTTSQFTDTAFLLRKDAGNYYSYVDLSESFPFQQPTPAEIIILKDNVAKGSTWQSATVSGNVSGVPISAYFKFTILDKAVPETIGRFNFNDVIKVKMEAYVNSVMIRSTEMWYAKNVGLIYVNDGTTIVQIGDYHIH
jgi:hypothetical protein